MMMILKTIKTNQMINCNIVNFHIVLINNDKR